MLRRPVQKKWTETTWFRVVAVICIIIVVILIFPLLLPGHKTAKVEQDTDSKSDGSHASSEDAKGTHGKSTKAPSFKHFRLDCKGKAAHELSCMMPSLWYDQVKNTFIVDSGPGGKPLSGSEKKRKKAEKEMHNKIKKLLPNNAKFQLGFTASDNDDDKSIPEDSVTCHIDQPVHLRAAFHPRSFGHMLRDNFQALASIPALYKKTAADFAWVTWPEPPKKQSRSKKKEKVEVDTTTEPSDTVLSFKAWLGDPDVWTWAGLMKEKCSSGEDTKKHKPRYVHFDTALISNGGTDWTKNTDRACKTASFQPLRDAAYQSAGVEHVPTADQKQQKIVLMQKELDSYTLAGERRIILNIDELVQKLQKKFPKAEVKAVKMKDMDHKEQMKLLSGTTVLIANMGSASFRQIFLPDGAQAILALPPGDSFAGLDGNMHHVKDPDREITACWADVSHWTVKPIQVPLQDAQIDIGRFEYIPMQYMEDGRPKAGWNEGTEGWKDKGEGSRDWWEVRRMWDASLRLDPKEVVKMVSQCLKDARKKPKHRKLMM